MAPVNLKEARRRLGTIVEAAARGESTTITRRGRRVAKVVPAGPDAGGSLPDLTEFRASIRLAGEALSGVVVRGRKGDRY